jgi:integral membrane protein
MAPLRWLRRIGLLEGASFLILLGVAMPLKYLGGLPMAVKIAGWIHGLLFVLLLALLMLTMQERRWPWTRGAMVVAAALLPFGPFVIDRRLRDEEAGNGEPRRGASGDGEALRD